MGSRMLARSGPWRRPRASARDRRALQLFLQVEHRNVRVVPHIAPERRDLAPRTRPRTHAAASAAALPESRAAPLGGGPRAEQTHLRRPSRRRARAGASRTSATSESAWTMSPSDEGRTTRTASVMAVPPRLRPHWPIRPLRCPPRDVCASRAKPRRKGRVCERGRRPTPQCNVSRRRRGGRSNSRLGVARRRSWQAHDPRHRGAELVVP